MGLRKVISGGQTGADIAGVIAADLAGIETGGWAPPGWLTEKGPDANLAEYGLKEHHIKGYVGRTYANAEDSDGTIRFAADFNSPGEICTLKAIEKYGKPHFDVDFNNPPPTTEVVDWIRDNKIEVLNVAGNRESKCIGLKNFVMSYLDDVFDHLEDE